MYGETGRGISLRDECAGRGRGYNEAKRKLKLRVPNENRPNKLY